MRGATRGIRRAALAGVAAAGLALVPAVADATPAAGVTGRIISQHTVGGKDYILREITIAPGGKTGWHFHDGTLYAFVAQGTLTHSDSSCQTDGIYRTGAAFTEPSGANHVHIGRNLGKKAVVLDVLYVLPAGAPLSEDAPNPGCDFE
ncbi:cupin domain-containing protein [Streptomyces sp. SID13031]|uniref:cupin domain-containing protein n=1 Tax=Streptomyces sp. SID13031 TaxID=2706046 RepID=UPI0013C8020C|nr:cupin domain-containing protein [Streptomyces sp. SID13031]NEA30454.1 cupin domain-containing protein [Streptomyces sp. SID13031]